jgi:hypothetical protein
MNNDGLLSTSASAVAKRGALANSNAVNVDRHARFNTSVVRQARLAGSCRVSGPPMSFGENANRLRLIESTATVNLQRTVARQFDARCKSYKRPGNSTKPRRQARDRYRVVAH